MLFSTVFFLTVFLPATLLLYYLAPQRLKNLILLLLSLLFYVWGEPKYFGIMAGVICLNYFSGRLMTKYDHQDGLRKIIYVVTLLANLGNLVLFKYANFIVDNLNEVFSSTGVTLGHLPKLALPVGISFYTFQCISYVTDIYRREVKEQKSLINLALYICLFPHLIAGPIVRYHDIGDQLEGREHHTSAFAAGIERFIIGLVKKILIANPLALVADELFNTPVAHITSVWAWVGIVAYSLQIYFDFSGYSDMAIGLARMFGFRFPENFNFPYVAQTIQDFWRRWHMSLSSWFRDYLYIPLGGNRLGESRTLLNLFLVFFATGLWHGASWNFIFWGLFHGFFLVLERMGLGKALANIWQPFRHAYTLLVVMIGWVFFRANDFSHGLNYVGAMFGIDPAPEAIKSNYAMIYLNGHVLSAAIIALLAASGIFVKVRTSLYATGLGIDGSPTGAPKSDAKAFLYVSGLVTLLLLAVTFMAADTYNPFIYFRF